MGAWDDVHPDRPLPLPDGQQQVVETGLRLTLLQQAVAAEYATGEGDDHGEVVARGPELFDYVLSASRGWRHLLATRTASPAGSAGMVRALQNNRRILDSGTTMRSVFSDHGFDEDLPDLLAGQPSDHAMGLVTVEMKILDRRKVMLEGPTVDGQRSLMIVDHPLVLAAAQAYWTAVRRSAIAAAELAERRAGASLAVFTPRQRAVVALLARDVADERAAELLDISVRTLRAEVAAVKDRLGVGTRFAAGVALGRLRAGG